MATSGKKRSVQRRARVSSGGRPRHLVVNGGDLRTEDLRRIIANPSLRVEVSRSARVRAKKAYEFLHREVGKRIIYGINTGFGPMASYIINQKNLSALQNNLVRSHATGMGEPLPVSYVLSAMVVRLNTLAKGYSGVSLKLLDCLASCINRRIIPVVPNHGAVGTSGDLVQLAHIALTLMGEGEVFYRNRRMPSKEALADAGITPHVLEMKEGLALMNGTSMMTGIMAILLTQANRLIGLSTRLGALALEIVAGFDDAYGEMLQSLRPHPGQRDVARALRSLVRGGKRYRRRKDFEKHLEDREDVHTIPDDVQEIYSLRCIPQIVGPVLDTYRSALRTIEIEMNAVTDNPIVDEPHGAFLHGGNFHGDYISLAADKLKIAITKLTILSERRINFFLNKNVNRRFPPFLNLKKPGMTLGLQGLQFVATSTTARSQTLSFPQYVHSIPTNGDNQDVVSMGTDAALLAAQVMEHAYVVLAIELVAAAQAVSVLGIEHQLGPAGRKLYTFLRSRFPAVVDDRVLAPELAKLTEAIRQGSELDVAWES